MKVQHRRTSKPARRSSNKKVAAKKVVASTRGRDAVALAVGRALMRKPKVNPALVAMFRANRDLLPQ